MLVGIPVASPWLPARSVLLLWKRPTQWFLWFSSAVGSEPGQAIRGTSRNKHWRMKKSLRKPPRCPQEGEEVSECSAGSRLGRIWDRAVCSRLSSLVPRQKVPTMGQALPSHSLRSSLGSTDTSQKCLGPLISEVRRHFWMSPTPIL